MLLLALACVFFLFLQLFVAGTSVKTRIIARISAPAYFALYGLASLFGLIWMFFTYFGAMGDPLNAQLWHAPFWLKIVALGVNFLAIQLIVVGTLSPSPVRLKANAVQPDKPISGIIRVTRHPVLAGLSLLAFMHMVCNGNLASWVFFGTVLALSYLGSYNLDLRREERLGDHYRTILKHTSFLPFVAIIQGRTRFDFLELGLLRLLVGTSLFAVLVTLHELLFLRQAL
ncbi:MAG: NnrU family protein [Asticcacaulis sp.]